MIKRFSCISERLNIFFVSVLNELKNLKKIPGAVKVSSKQKILFNTVNSCVRELGKSREDLKGVSEIPVAIG